MNSYLPSELLADVFGHLDRDALTLKSCALVNRTWTPEAQRVLFHACFIRIGSPEERWRDDKGEIRRSELAEQSKGSLDFLGMMHASPHIAPLIKRMRLNLTDIYREYNGPCTHKYNRARAESPGSHWSFESLVSTIMAISLPNLDTLSVFRNAWPNDCQEKHPYLSFYGIFPQAEAGWNSLIRYALRSVTRLGILGLHTPVQFCSLSSFMNFLSCFDELTELALGDVNARYDPGINERWPDFRIALQRLRLQKNSRHDPFNMYLIQWLRVTETMWTIQDLVVEDWPGVTDGFFTSLGAARQPWRLEIIVNRGDAGYYDGARRFFPRLGKLILRFGQEQRHVNVTYRWLARCKAPELKRIQISYEERGKVVPDGYNRGRGPQIRRVLDFPSLEKVVFTNCNVGGTAADTYREMFAVGVDVRFIDGHANI